MSAAQRAMKTRLITALGLFFDIFMLTDLLRRIVCENRDPRVLGSFLVAENEDVAPELSLPMLLSKCKLFSPLERRGSTH